MIPIVYLKIFNWHSNTLNHHISTAHRSMYYLNFRRKSPRNIITAHFSFLLLRLMLSILIAFDQRMIKKMRMKDFFRTSSSAFQAVEKLRLFFLNSY